MQVFEIMDFSRQAYENRGHIGTDELVCDLGTQSKLYEILYDETGCEHRHMLVAGSAYGQPLAYPIRFRMAQRWFRRKRVALRTAIVEQLGERLPSLADEGTNQFSFLEHLTKIVAPHCNDPHPVEPAVVAVILLRIGIDRFIADGDTGSQDWSLERALGWDWEAANTRALEGRDFLFRGDWKRACRFYEEARACHPLHPGVLNDLSYIYATYAPGTEIGLTLAKLAVSNTSKGDPNACSVLDTLGWSFCQHDGNLTESEKYLRAALDVAVPGESLIITIKFHLMTVLKRQGKRAEMLMLFKTLDPVPPMNALEEEAYLNALKLVSWRHRLWVRLRCDGRQHRRKTKLGS